MEPWWNPGGTLVEPWWNPGGTLVEPWWNPGGTLVEPCLGPPRTTPEPIWAETPKLSAVGEQAHYPTNRAEQNTRQNTSLQNKTAKHVVLGGPPFQRNPNGPLGTSHKLMPGILMSVTVSNRQKLRFLFGLFDLEDKDALLLESVNPGGSMWGSMTLQKPLWNALRAYLNLVLGLLWLILGLSWHRPPLMEGSVRHFCCLAGSPNLFRNRLYGLLVPKGSQKEADRSFDSAPEFSTHKPNASNRSAVVEGEADYGQACESSKCFA